MAKQASQLKKGSTPTLILAILTVRPMYGYEIAREVERRTKGQLTFKEGTLYPTLHALERQGLIEGRWEEEPLGRESALPRKYYSITESGLAAFATSAQELRQFARAILSIVGEAGNA